jgi:cathepsin X
VKNYTGGVFFDTTNATEIDHDISVVGYGIDNQTGWKYWLIRNSWGTYWVRIMLWSGFCWSPFCE